MKYIKLIIVMLAAIACVNHDLRPTKCFKIMTFSDALPIQVYLNGQQSFNQSIVEEEYVDEHCFHQEFACSDEIKFQGKDNDGGDFDLQVLEEGGGVLTTLPMIGTSSPFLTPLASGYENGTDGMWEIDASPEVERFVTSFPLLTSLYLLPFNGAVSGGLYQFNYNIQAISGTGQIHIYLKDEDLNNLDEFDISFSGAETFSGQINFIAGPSIPKFIAFEMLGVTGTARIKINQFDLVDQGSGSYFYEVKFTPTTIGICDKYTWFKILKRANIVLNNSFNDNTEWSNIGVGGNWTIADGLAFVTFVSSAQSSKKFTESLPASHSGNVRVEIGLIQTATSNVVNFRLGLGSEDVHFATTGAGRYVFESSVSAVPSFNVIDFEASSPGIGDKQVRIEYIKVTVDSSAIFIGFTDSVKFSTTPLPSQLIRYKSSKNFAGLVAGDGSYFNLRLKGQFFFDDDVVEVTSIQLSNSVIIDTSAFLSKKRKLVLDAMADYMHTKVQLILMHAVSGSVVIKGHEWIRAEGGEYSYIDSPSETYPFRGAEIMLTRKNYLTTNVI